MNYDFSSELRFVLGRARIEAQALRHDYIGTEHMLLALVRQRRGGAAEMLTHAGITEEEVDAQIRALVPKGKGDLASGELPYTSRGKKTLEFAMAAARAMRSQQVDTEHLLLGLLKEEKGIGAQVLNRLGLTLAVASAMLGRKGEAFLMDAEMPGRSGMYPSMPKKREGPRFRVRIDDASDKSIYEQIIAQTQEAVATGALKPGDRLLAVRQLADELDIAPGTVARAYSELERLGVVVTDGARGTRVADPQQKRVADNDRPETLIGLMRPVAVAAFHLGASSDELRGALEQAMAGIYPA
ncbi:MAG: Clp protease N-terminal domain-containing protein [Longimicrobiales bacterium]